MTTVNTTSTALGTPTVQTRVTCSGTDSILVTQGSREVLLHPGGSEVLPAGTAITALALHVTSAATLTDATVATLTISDGHVVATGAAPTAAAGAGAGTSPPDPVLTGADTRGTVTFGSGTSTAAGAVVAITFATAYDSAPSVEVTPNNTATEALGVYASATTTVLTVSTTSAPTASQANTVYSVSYQVIG